MILVGLYLGAEQGSRHVSVDQKYTVEHNVPTNRKAGDPRLGTCRWNVRGRLCAGGELRWERPWFEQVEAARKPFPSFFPSSNFRVSTLQGHARESGVRLPTVAGSMWFMVFLSF